MATTQTESLSMVVVMGVTGSGKSYFINRVAGKQIVEEGSDLESCTSNCQLVPADIGRSKVLLVDTPGFDDTTRTDSEILEEIARLLAAQYKLGVELKGIIYVHRITDVRYTKSAVKTFDIFRKICGDSALKNVLLVTSRWNEVDETVGSKRERQLRERFWSYMLARGSHLSRFHGDHDSAVGLISQLLCKDTVTLSLQKELVDEGKQLDETVAGSYVSDNLDKLKRQYEKDLADLERLKQELLDSDRAMKRQLQKDWDLERSRLQDIQQQQVSLQKPVAQEVDKEIRKKRSGMSKFLPFIPTALGILGMFVGIPSGVTSMLTSWISESGTDPSGIMDSITESIFGF